MSAATFLIIILILSIAVMVITSNDYGEPNGCAMVVFTMAVVGLIAWACGAFEPPSPKELKEAADRKAATEQEEKKQNALNERLNSGEVILVSTAPDGTKLWMAKNKLNGEVVYYSTGGATIDGKSVPTARGSGEAAPAPRRPL